MSNMYEKMMEMDGTQMVFSVDRTATAQDRDGLSYTMSQQAFDALREQMTTWIGTRILKYQDEIGLMPQMIQVSVDVNMSA